MTEVLNENIDAKGRGSGELRIPIGKKKAKRLVPVLQKTLTPKHVSHFFLLLVLLVVFINAAAKSVRLIYSRLVKPEYPMFSIEGVNGSEDGLGVAVYLRSLDMNSLKSVALIEIQGDVDAMDAEPEWCKQILAGSKDRANYDIGLCT